MYNKQYSHFVNFLLFCFPLVINTVKSAGDLILLILATSGIFIAISNRKSPFSTEGLKLFSWVTFGYFLAVVLSVALSDKPTELAHYISRELYFLFAPFIGLAIFKAKLSLNHLLLGIKLGLILLGAITINQHLNGVIRPSGIMNAGIFANLTVMMLFLSIANIFKENFWNQIFTLGSAFMGIIAIVTTGTRGAWLSFLILTAIYIYLVYKHHLAHSRKIILITIITFTAIIGISAGTSIVQDRIILAKNEAGQWVDNKSLDTSIGLRLEIWSSALKAVKQHPWFGYGYRNTNPVVANYAGQEAKKIIANFNHLHNEYLTNFLGRGVLGLLSLLALLFLPLILFFKYIHGDQAQPQASMGILLCVGYASFGLVNITFGDVFMNAFYVFFLSILLPLNYTRSRNL